MRAGCAAHVDGRPPVGGDALYDALLDQHQREIRDWGARVEAAKGTEGFAAVLEEGREIEVRYLPRFLELAEVLVRGG